MYQTLVQTSQEQFILYSISQLLQFLIEVRQLTGLSISIKVNNKSLDINQLVRICNHRDLLLKSPETIP